MAKEKVKSWEWSWKTAILMGCLGAIIALMLYFGATTPAADTYCIDNPEDNQTCQCTIWMAAHVRFWDEYNDTTPDILEIIRNNTYRERLQTTTVAEIINNKLWVSNLSQDYNVYYNYEVVPRRCVEAMRR